MYEDFYGFVEKPFSLTPDPKYLYKSESHANAFDLLQYGIRRREGFIVVTGDIGTGKPRPAQPIRGDAKVGRPSHGAGSAEVRLVG